MNISLSTFAPANLVSRDGLGSPAPRQPAHLPTQAESDAYLRDSSRFPRRRPFICFNRYTPSGQSRVYRVAQLRTDGVHCRESAGTWPVNLKVVPNGCCPGRSPWTNEYAPIFPTPTMGMKWACRKYRRVYRAVSFIFIFIEWYCTESILSLAVSGVSVVEEVMGGAVCVRVYRIGSISNETQKQRHRHCTA